MAAKQLAKPELRHFSLSALSDRLAYLFCPDLLLFFFFLKSPIVSSITKKLYKKERTCWGDDHFAVCHVVQ